MKEALVIHCKLSVYAGAEYLCFYACKVLQDLGYNVNLLSDAFDPLKAEELYQMGNVLSKCRHIQLPPQNSKLPLKLVPLERLLYAIRLARFSNSLSQMKFSIILSTQSSIFSFPGQKLYHFVYEATDLFGYPMPLIKWELARGNAARRVYFALLGTIYTTLARKPTPSWFFVTGHRVLRRLNRIGFKNSSFIYPPSRVFKNRLPKKKQIVQASRIAPEKRVEFLFEAARKLPNYKFYLVGKNLPGQKLSNPGYAEQLLAQVPPNVGYIEATLKPGEAQLLEESKVYFHTGLEKGMLSILMEAMSAGCILVVPTRGVAGELVRDSGIGYQFDTLEEAVEKLKTAMEEDSPWTPTEISERARHFGSEAFERTIRQLVPQSRVD